MITDPIFYLVAIPAVLILGISKSGFGGGLGIVGVPMMALVIPPSQAAAILLPILCIMDLFAMWGFRGRFDKKNLFILIPAALVGIAIGALTFRYLNDDLIKLLIGAVTVIFCGHWFVTTLQKKETPKQPANAARGRFWGVIAGFTSFSVHSGGPPLSLYLLPQRLDKTIFVGTTVVFFTIVNYVKLVPYSYLGLLETGNLTTSLMLIPLAPIGIKLGMYFHNKINTNLFFKIIYSLLFLAGCKLLWDAISGYFVF